jgi:cytoplasmic iron level regulating protein YaaA (DUF328/UPF0246 family)
LFIKSLAYAKKLKPDKIYILSSKYGLLNLDDVIEPYDVELKSMPASEVKKWATRVIQQLRNVSNLENDQFTILAGKAYRKYLEPVSNITQSNGKYEDWRTTASFNHRNQIEKSPNGQA